MPVRLRPNPSITPSLPHKTHRPRRHKPPAGRAVDPPPRQPHTPTPAPPAHLRTPPTRLSPPSHALRLPHNREVLAPRFHPIDSPPTLAPTPTRPSPALPTLHPPTTPAFAPPPTSAEPSSASHVTVSSPLSPAPAPAPYPPAPERRLNHAPCNLAPHYRHPSPPHRLSTGLSFSAIPRLLPPSSLSTPFPRLGDQPTSRPTPMFLLMKPLTSRSTLLKRHPPHLHPHTHCPPLRPPNRSHHALAPDPCRDPQSKDTPCTTLAPCTLHHPALPAPHGPPARGPPITHPPDSQPSPPPFPPHRCRPHLVLLATGLPVPLHRTRSGPPTTVPLRPRDAGTTPLARPPPFLRDHSVTTTRPPAPPLPLPLHPSPVGEAPYLTPRARTLLNPCRISQRLHPRSYKPLTSGHLPPPRLPPPARPPPPSPASQYSRSSSNPASTSHPLPTTLRPSPPNTPPRDSAPPNRRHTLQGFLALTPRNPDLCTCPRPQNPPTTPTQHNTPTINTSRPPNPPQQNTLPPTHPPHALTLGLPPLNLASPRPDTLKTSPTGLGPPRPSHPPPAHLPAPKPLTSPRATPLLLNEINDQTRPLLTRPPTLPLAPVPPPNPPLSPPGPIPHRPQLAPPAQPGTTPPCVRAKTPHPDSLSSPRALSSSPSLALCASDPFRRRAHPQRPPNAQPCPRTAPPPQPPRKSDLKLRTNLHSDLPFQHENSCLNPRVQGRTNHTVPQPRNSTIPSPPSTLPPTNDTRWSRTQPATIQIPTSTTHRRLNGTQNPSKHPRIKEEGQPKTRLNKHANGATTRTYDSGRQLDINARPWRGSRMGGHPKGTTEAYPGENPRRNARPPVLLSRKLRTSDSTGGTRITAHHMLQSSTDRQNNNTLIRRSSETI
ncbi:uncharacterized protein LOC128980099 [Indicator indicator]|uniref:uncharacterized protein LOC128980099 n=1 Tax=Indicator indicator TaxID=1002788 RepID=UPI0023DF5BA0|nr:uncharacterized protein LOC128980099 [Indicator indicator]